MKKDNRELFETTPIPKAVAVLCIPTILSTLVMMLYNLADTYFVGMLNDPIQNAAVTIAGPVMLAFNAVNNLFGVGASSVMSRALGRKDYDTVRNASCFSFYCALICAAAISILHICFKLPLMNVLGADETTRDATAKYMLWTVSCGACPAIMNVVLSYMIRSEGFAMHASAGMMSGCLLNIVFDPFFILPQFLDMGAAGAGFATFTANCIACLYFIVLLRVKKNSTYISLNPKYIRVSKPVMLDIFGVGIPASIQNLLNVTGMTVLNNFTAAYGSSAVAAMGIAHKVSMIPLYFSMGLGQGVMPLISYNYTSGDHRRLKEGFNFVVRLVIAVSITLTLLVFVNSGFIIRSFIQNKDVIIYGSKFLQFMSIGIPCVALDFFAVAIFQALGKGKYSLIFAILRKIVLEIPFIVILNYIYPLYGMALSQPAAELILAVVAVIILRRIIKNLDI